VCAPNGWNDRISHTDPRVGPPTSRTIARMEALDFTCPRCGRDATESFYGPCASCRAELVETMQREAAAVVVAAYEPKMNVVPTQVATKD